MENSLFKPWSIIITILFATLIIGGGVFFYFKNSPSKPKNQPGKETQIPHADIENKSLLPAGVEWQTYQDRDISFTYPTTFLGTPLQEKFDKNLGRETWQVLRDENTIYIRPTFESPATEFGATYEIKIMKDTWEAEKEWNKAAKLHQGPESVWGEKLNIQAKNHYVGVLRNLDFGLGQIADVYFLMPEGIDEQGQSKKPTEKHLVIFASPDEYRSYIENILIPSIEIK